MKRSFRLSSPTCHVSQGARTRRLARLSLLVLLALTLALVGACAHPAAQVKVAHTTGTPNGWTLTNGFLNTARVQDTATLLDNGKVLVVGGTDSHGNLLASAELYDPGSGTWSLTGSLSTPRYLHTATLLDNG